MSSVMHWLCMYIGSSTSVIILSFVKIVSLLLILLNVPVLVYICIVHMQCTKQFRELPYFTLSHVPVKDTCVLSVSLPYE
jgi:hypothetical protein